MEERPGPAEVNFCCQRCGEPLKLDASFNAVDDRLVTELAAPVVLLKPSARSEPVVLETSEDGVTRRVTAPLQVSDTHGIGGALDFMLVGDNVHPEAGGFSSHLEMTAQLFDVLTDESEVEHPLCEECTDSLLDLMESELTLAEAEVKDYKKYLSERSENDDESVEKLAADLQKVQAEEKRLIAQLARMEAEHEEVVRKRNALSAQLERLREDERKQFKEYMNLKREWIYTNDEKISMKNQLNYAKTQLDLLEKTNVFNATFHIWHDGHFGTINGFRLGKLPDVPVEWKEINIAWGQTVLLMSSLAKRMDLTFENYRLVPFGDHAHIEVLSDKGVDRLPLYHTGGLRFLYDVKFDQGMVAFLDCLAQFKNEVERRNSDFTLPYSMSQGTITDNNSEKAYSIKYQMNSEEEWTKALKFMLTNLKWAVAYYTASLRDQS